MDLTLNNLQRLICHKTETTHPPTNSHRIHTYIYIYTLTHTHIYIYTHTHRIHTYIYAQTLTHIHTHREKAFIYIEQRSFWTSDSNKTFKDIIVLV